MRQTFRSPDQPLSHLCFLHLFKGMLDTGQHFEGAPGQQRGYGLRFIGGYHIVFAAKADQYRACDGPECLGAQSVAIAEAVQQFRRTAHDGLPIGGCMAFGEQLGEGRHFFGYFVRVEAGRFFGSRCGRPVEFGPKGKNALYAFRMFPRQVQGYITTHAVSENLHLFYLFLI